MKNQRSSIVLIQLEFDRVSSLNLQIGMTLGQETYNGT
jgi:hypothetical protein